MTACDSDDLDDVESTQPTALLRDLQQLTGVSCVACDRRLCGHEALFSVAMGLKQAPRCLACLAKGLDRSAPELGDQLVDYIQHRDCYRHAWDVASKQEGLAQATSPACPWARVALSTANHAAQTKPEDAAAQVEEPPTARTWDAGDMGCGDLVLELRIRLNSLPAGAVLEVIARDPGAPQDMPAWCRLTGQRLVQAAHPRYLIQRKEP